MAELKVTHFKEESGHEAYMKSLRKDLLDTMEAAGCSEVINHQRNKLGIASEMIDCDLYMTYTMESAQALRGTANIWRNTAGLNMQPPY